MARKVYWRKKLLLIPLFYMLSIPEPNPDLWRLHHRAFIRAWHDTVRDHILKLLIHVPTRSLDRNHRHNSDRLKRPIAADGCLSLHSCRQRVVWQNDKRTIWALVKLMI